MQLIEIRSEVLFSLSPYLNMQFMEPLSASDSSVDIGWDYLKDCWKEEIMNIAQTLAPKMIRWGGCISSYYHWKEAIGPISERRPMINILWGGMFSNHVGTDEFLDFCKKVSAEPLIVVNMESDGKLGWAYPKPGEDRFGTAKEASEWVDYCNNPDNPLRKKSSDKNTSRVNYWQIGNETSYNFHGDPGYDMVKAAEVTKRFAKEMKNVDSSIKLIAWGQDIYESKDDWAGKMCEIAGEDIDYIAFHHHYNMFQHHYYTKYKGKTPLYGPEYKEDWENSWKWLMNADKHLKEEIDELREVVKPYGKRLAMTESHFSIPDKNRNALLSTWAAGVAYGKIMNTLSRNGDILDIATNADFFGNCWQTNAILCPSPGSMPYFQPVGSVMALFGRNVGNQAIYSSSPHGLDIFTSQDRDSVFVHVVNITIDKHIQTKVKIDSNGIEEAEVFQIAGDYRSEVSCLNPNVFEPKTLSVTDGKFSFPAASVSVIKIDKNRMAEIYG